MDERQHSRSPITSFNINNQWYDMPLQVLIFLAVATVPKYGSEADRVDSIDYDCDYILGSTIFGCTE